MQEALAPRVAQEMAAGPIGITESATQPPTGLCPGPCRLPESDPGFRDSISILCVFSSFSW